MGKAWKKGHSDTIRPRPTRTGYLFILINLSMLIASINYANNMAFIFTFLMFSMLINSVLFGKKNLKQIRLQRIAPENVFAGNPMKINLTMNNPGSKPKFGLWLSHPTNSRQSDFNGPYFIDSGSECPSKLFIYCNERGRFNISEIKVSTLFPMGLFLITRHIPVNKPFLVYPKPMGDDDWDESTTGFMESEEGTHTKGGDDFTGLRPYREGEPMQHIDWKSYARGRALSVKEFSGGGKQQLLFSLTKVIGLGLEPALSQLCKWILTADKMGLPFGLDLEGQLIPVDSSTNHTLNCLEALSLYPKKTDEHR